MTAADIKLARESRRLHAATSKGKLETLLGERRRWQRKQTIATTKLDEVDRAILNLTSAMADALYELEYGKD